MPDQVRHDDKQTRHDDKQLQGTYIIS